MIIWRFSGVERVKRGKDVSEILNFIIYVQCAHATVEQRVSDGIISLVLNTRCRYWYFGTVVKSVSWYFRFEIFRKR